MIRCFTCVARDEQGTVAIEYGLILLIISIVAIASMIALGASVNTFFSNASTALR